MCVYIYVLLRSISDAAPDSKKRVKRLEEDVDGVDEVELNEDLKVSSMSCAYLNWVRRSLKEAEERKAGRRDKDEEMASETIYQLQQSLKEADEWMAEEEEVQARIKTGKVELEFKEEGIKVDGEGVDGSRVARRYPGRQYTGLRAVLERAEEVAKEGLVKLRPGQGWVLRWVLRWRLWVRGRGRLLKRR